MEIMADHTIILDKGSHLPQQDDVSFVVEISQSINARTALILKQGNMEVSISDYPATYRTIEYLLRHESPAMDEFPEDIRQEISDIHTLLSDCTIRVLSLIKYHLPYMDLSEQLFSIKSRRWRLPETDWKVLPSSLSIVFDSRTVPHYDDVTCKLIQDSLNENVVPLIGMRHLHRAKNETLPHHKWIDATIAAELAVKEVLVRARPELEALMLELPAPPLTKLYGLVLQAYLGERSPYLAVIRGGVEVRNRLLHRPSREKVDHQKAVNYVNDIERAIFHLLSLLYPGNGLISSRVRMVTHS